MTPFTWGDRGISDSCTQADEATDPPLFHAINVSKLDAPVTWSFGDMPLKPFKIRPGETVNVEVEWNFTNEAHAKDWSITCFGDGTKDTLHLTHDMGLGSDSWQPTTRQEPKKKKVLPPPPAPPVPDAQSEAVFREWVESY